MTKAKKPRKNNPAQEYKRKLAKIKDISVKNIQDH